MKYQSEQQGFVSLFTAIMISLLLLVITISLVSIEALQLRKSEDAEQSLRAYYTAEAGVEDAVSKVLSGVIALGVGDNTCNNNTGYDAAGDAGWTCQQVSFTGAPTGVLPNADVATTVDPGHVTPVAYQSILLQWDQSTNPTAAEFNVVGGLPSEAAYTANYAAAPIELSIVKYPDGGFASNQVCAGETNLPLGCDVTLENALILPGGVGGAGSLDVSSPAFKNGSPFMGNCAPRVAHGTPASFDGTTDYNCYEVINGFDPSGNNDYLFRIRSRYLRSSYKMTFYSGAGATASKVQVPDGTATIDVTARAGQAYRRVIYTLPLTKGAAGGLNFVIFSDNNICKNFDVINNVAQSGCPY